MKRLAPALFALCLAAGALAAPLPATVRHELKTAGIPQSGVAIVVQEVGKHRPLLGLNAAQAMNPASTIKLLTTFAALDLLGPAYTWRTEAYLDGALKDGILNGDLIIKGYGDPKFTIEQFWLWLAELRSRGLREIRGDLVLDRSHFDLPPFDPGAFDNDPVRAYNAGPDALLLNFNTLKLTYLPEGDALRVISQPLLDGITLDNRLVAQPAGNCDDWDDGILIETGNSIVFQGGYPAECGERAHNLNLMPHTRYVETVFRTLWKELGGTLQGRQREGVAGEHARLFSTHRSEPLALTIRDINKYSNNVMARQLFLTLGDASPQREINEAATPLASAPQTLSIARSVQTVHDWLRQQKLDYPELVLENGAGLSRVERISADHLATLLQRATVHPLSAEFQASLPILSVDGTMRKRLKGSPASSHAHLKTGSLESVKTLAGYVRSKSGREWVVVLFINEPNARNGKAAQDALIEWVQGQ